MALAADLTKLGWNLSPEGIEECANDCNDARSVIKKALDLDLRNIGASILPDDINKGKRDWISGDCVLQIVKVSNVSAPKANEDSSVAPRLLKILLTDGHSTCSALDLGHLKCIDCHTPPGTKIKLKGSKIPCQCGFVIITNSIIEVLGGQVEVLLEKWRLNQQLANYTRNKIPQDGGPPPWVPFGHKIITGGVQEVSGKFKSLNVSSAKEGKDNDAFEQQRKVTIAEAAKAKIGGRRVFGGGKQISERDFGNDTTYEKKIEPFSGFESNSVVRPNSTKGKPVRESRERPSESFRSDHDHNQHSRRERPQGKWKGQKEEQGNDAISNAPSKPSTLFDFLESKIPSIGNKSVAESAVNKANVSNSGSVQSTFTDNSLSATFWEKGCPGGSGRCSSKKSGERTSSFSGSRSSDQRYSRNPRVPPLQKNSNSHTVDNTDQKLNSTLISTSEKNFPRLQKNAALKQNIEHFKSADSFDATRTPTDCSILWNAGGSSLSPSGYKPHSFVPNSVHSEPCQTQKRVHSAPNRSQKPSSVPNMSTNETSMQKVNHNSQFSGSSKMFWKPGDECIAKYWEDNKFYPAVVHAVAPNGATCVVLFSKYNNYEEVFVGDLRPVDCSNRSEGQGDCKIGNVEFRRGGTRPYAMQNPHSFGQIRTNGRPSQQVYVPPAQRQ